MPITIFFCYAREDEAFLNKLKAHLRPLQRQGLIDVWYDRNISPGAEWEPEITKKLNAAQIILLLVSPDFMNSDYCYGIEMQRALERHRNGEATVIPIILRPVYWHSEPLGKLQALPTDGKPVTDPEWHDQDRAFYAVTNGISAVVAQLATTPVSALPPVAEALPQPVAQVSARSPIIATPLAKPPSTTPAGNITEFPVPTSASGPWGITAGPDGNLWFTESDGNKVGRISTSGIITEFPLRTSANYPSAITAGPDGNLWFTESAGNNIGRISTTGVITEFPLPTSYNVSTEGITAGPDGNLWFTEPDDDKIGRISTSGTITEFPLPTYGSGPGRITAGPDGNLWFIERDGHKIGRISTSGTITEFPLPPSASDLFWITVGPDGNLWFTEHGGNKIGCITSGK